MVVCGGDRDGTVDFIEPEDPGLVAASYPSLTWVVNDWVELFEQELWGYDRERGR